MSENEKLHRELWHWIAEETSKQKRVICKQEWFAKNLYCVDNDCFACREALDRWFASDDLGVMCQYCPLKWGTEKYYASDFCIHDDALYNQWLKIGAGLSDWQVAADLADRIAEMKWRQKNNDTT